MPYRHLTERPYAVPQNRAPRSNSCDLFLFMPLPPPPRLRAPASGENDHDAVRRVGEMVTSKVTTIPCMVDRICTGRQIGKLNRS